MTHGHRQPPGAGKSSFELLDPDLLVENLKLQPGCTMVDVGCGEGRYALLLARRLGPAGTLYALDLWEEGLALLAARASWSGRWQPVLSSSGTQPYSLHASQAICRRGASLWACRIGHHSPVNRSRKGLSWWWSIESI